jgi:hypothetical protein
MHYTLFTRKGRSVRVSEEITQQNALLWPILSPTFRQIGEDVVVPTIKMTVARRVAQVLNMAYEYDPTWTALKVRRKRATAVNDSDDEEEGPTSGTAKGKCKRRISLSFILAFAFWGGHDDLEHLPGNEVLPYQWPGATHLPSNELGIGLTREIRKAMTKKLSHEPINPLTVGVANSPCAVSKCVMKLARNNNVRTAILYASRLDASGAKARRLVIRMAHHYGLSIATITSPFRPGQPKTRDSPDTTRFVSCTHVLMELATHSDNTVNYATLESNQGNGMSCNIPSADPRRVALMIAKACAPRNTPGANPNQDSTVMAYSKILEAFRAYLSVRVSEAQIEPTEEEEGQLKIVKIKTKSIVHLCALVYSLMRMLLVYSRSMAIALST